MGMYGGIHYRQDLEVSKEPGSRRRLSTRELARTDWGGLCRADETPRVAGRVATRRAVARGRATRGLPRPLSLMVPKSPRSPCSLAFVPHAPPLAPTRGVAPCVGWRPPQARGPPLDAHNCYPDGDRWTVG